MTGPREWRHAGSCKLRYYDSSSGCTCGLSAVRDAIAAGHRVVIGPDGVEGRLEKYEPPWGWLVVPLEEEP